MIAGLGTAAELAAADLDAESLENAKMKLVRDYFEHQLSGVSQSEQVELEFHLAVRQQGRHQL